MASNMVGLGDRGDYLSGNWALVDSSGNKYGLLIVWVHESVPRRSEQWIATTQTLDDAPATLSAYATSTLVTGTTTASRRSQAEGIIQAFAASGDWHGSVGDRKVWEIESALTAANDMLD